MVDPPEETPGSVLGNRVAGRALGNGDVRMRENGGGDQNC